MSGNDSSAIAQREYRAKLKDGAIVIEGVDGFSVDVDAPKLNVGKLYRALFKDIDRPTQVLLEPDVALRQDSKAFAFFESIKKIVEGACEKMNPELEKFCQRAEGDNPSASSQGLAESK